VLEITTPTRPILSRFYRVWFDRIVPLLGRLAGAGVAFASRLGGSAPGDAVADAYTYLPSSVKRFPEPAVLAAELARAGLTEVSYVLMAGGIVAVHAGTVTSKQA
jgi:demethylmenaquinone methyltransferase/2-methoxy-6-polyprenyl-1,4-benzoquinol methylase